MTGGRWREDGGKTLLQLGIRSTGCKREGLEGAKGWRRQQQAEEGAAVAAAAGALQAISCAAVADKWMARPGNFASTALPLEE